MIELADQLEASGNLEGAADVRNDIIECTRPRPVVAIRCDCCGGPVGKRAAAHYDTLGVDWAHCAPCDARGALLSARAES